MDFEYTVENGGVAITKYVGTDVGIIIPDEIDGKKVVKIKRHTFYENYTLQYLVIPDGIKVLEDMAIRSCEALQRVDIPKSVTFIDRICEGCPKLTEIHVDEENARYCFYDGLLLTKDKSELMRCLNSTAGKSYRVPDYVETIHNAAFASLRDLEEIEIHDNVRKMGWSVFHSCYHLKSVRLSQSLDLIAGEMFGNCYSLESITIPKSVVKMNNRTFLNCNSLKEVTFEGKTFLVGNPFEGCDTHLTIKGISGSSVEKFAKGNGFTFEPIE